MTIAAPASSSDDEYPAIELKGTPQTEANIVSYLVSTLPDPEPADDAETRRKKKSIGQTA